MVRWLLGVLVLVQPFVPSAQAQTAAPSPAAAGASPSVGQNYSPSPAQTSVSLSPRAVPTRAPGDTCGASELAGLIGQPRTAIPVPADLSRRRVICTTCPRTMDYVPSRLTIFYDRATSRVTTLQCG